MRDAAGHLDAAQLLEQRVGRAPHVQDHRQAMAAGKLELCDVEMLLALAVQPRHEVVQADLADGHQPRVVARVSQRLVEPLQVGVLGAVDVQRMDAQRVGEAMPLRQGAGSLEVHRSHRRDHHLPDAGGAGARHHRVAVGVELGRVEMAMGVCPHGAHHASAVTGHGRRATVATHPEPRSPRRSSR
jgi:hypothetical protein